MITGSSCPGILGIGIWLFVCQRGKPKARRRLRLNAQAEADFRASGEREQVSGWAPASQQPVVRKRSSQHRSVKRLAVRSGPGAGCVLEGQRSSVSRGRDDGDGDREWASGFGRVGLPSVSHQQDPRCVALPESRGWKQLQTLGHMEGFSGCNSSAFAMLPPRQTLCGQSEGARGRQLRGSQAGCCLLLTQHTLLADGGPFLIQVLPAPCWPSSTFACHV